MAIARVNFGEIERANGNYVIEIKTLKYSNNYMYAEFFPKKWNVRGYVSEINFSNALIDFEGHKNNILTLSTFWSDNMSPTWNIHLLEEEKRFGKLNEPFGSYSKKRLIDWQKEAFSVHRRALLKLEDLFYQNGEIKEDFLSYVNPAKSDLFY